MKKSVLTVIITFALSSAASPYAAAKSASTDPGDKIVLGRDGPVSLHAEKGKLGIRPEIEFENGTRVDAEIEWDRSGFGGSIPLGKHRRGGVTIRNKPTFGGDGVEIEGYYEQGF